MKICAEPGCPALSAHERCPEHRRASFAAKRSRYPRQQYGPEWQKIRRRALRRDGYRCQWEIAGGICGKPASEVDHILPLRSFGSRRAAHDLANLQSLCKPHHAAKTAAEMRAQRFA